MEIDSIITHAVLKEVRVLDYNKFIKEKDDDLEQLRIILKRQNITDSKAYKELETEISNLQKQANGWVKQVGLKEHRVNRIVILIEEYTGE